MDSARGLTRTASNSASIFLGSRSVSAVPLLSDLPLKAATRPITLVPFLAIVRRSLEVDLAALPIRSVLLSVFGRAFVFFVTLSLNRESPAEFVLDFDCDCF